MRVVSTEVVPAGGCGCPEEGCLLAEFQQETLPCHSLVTQKPKLPIGAGPSLLPSITSSVWLKVPTEGPFTSPRR